MECAFYIYLFFLFPMQSVLGVSFYVCIKEEEEEEDDDDDDDDDDDEEEEE